MKLKKLLTHSLGNPKLSFSYPEALTYVKVYILELKMFIEDQQCSKDTSCILDVPLSNKDSKRFNTVPPLKKKIYLVTSFPV